MSPKKQPLVGFGVLLVLGSILFAGAALLCPIVIFLPWLSSALGSNLLLVMGAARTLYLISGVCGVVGKLLCLSTPDRTARILLIISLALEVAGAYMQTLESGYAVYLTLVGFLVFVAFLSQVARAVERPDLEKMSSYTVWTGVAAILFIPTLGGKLHFLGLEGAILAVLAIAFLPFLLYISLLLRLFLALKG